MQFDEIKKTGPSHVTQKPQVMKDMSLGLQGTHKQVFCKKSKKRRSCKKKMAMMQNLYGRFDLASSAKYRAEEVQSRLSTKYPSFMKPMIRSNVTAGFWLSLPRFFCQLHLPRHDTTVTLVDESQEEYKTKYLAERNGLSGGWRGFSLAHNLVEGDVLVFQLFRFCRLKVYIVRANYLAEVDAALVLLHLDAHQKQIDPVHQMQDNRSTKQAGIKRQRFSSQREEDDYSAEENMLHKHSHPRITFKDLDLPSKAAGLTYETLSIVDAVKASKINDPSSWNTRPTELEQLEIRYFSCGYSIEPA
ncbi:B3 domain-containing protein At5g42700-like isoform X4 [Nicotiana tomentosiformis]|uniref:B3 domain-containing protein At5g42700-like isoform X4 n=1 Tax=Nicotiana tomentosiformis TaxID=4098 RepID=UPI00388CC743